MEISLEEIENLLEGNGREYDEEADDQEEFGWYFWLWEGHKDAWTILNNKYMARTVHTLGGSEGGGENVEIVVEVTPHFAGVQKFSMESRFFEKLGYYASFDGCDFDGSFTEVWPQQKTITVYERA